VLCVIERVVPPPEGGGEGGTPRRVYPLASSPLASAAWGRGCGVVPAPAVMVVRLGLETSTLEDAA
jgi:hypothetical protein